MNYNHLVAELLADRIDEGKTPWRTPASCAPSNIPSAGIETLVLNIRSNTRGYQDGRWYSELAIEANGWEIKEGEKGISLPIAIKSATLNEDGSLDSNIRDSYHALYNAEQIDGIEHEITGKKPAPLGLQEILDANIHYGNHQNDSIGIRFTHEIVSGFAASKFEGIEARTFLDDKELEILAVKLRNNPQSLTHVTKLAQSVFNDSVHAAELREIQQELSKSIPLQGLTVWRTDEGEYGYRANPLDGNPRSCNMLQEHDLQAHLGIVIADATIDKLSQTGVHNERTGRTTTTITSDDIGGDTLAVPRFTAEYIMDAARKEDNAQAMPEIDIETRRFIAETLNEVKEAEASINFSR